MVVEIGRHLIGIDIPLEIAMRRHIIVPGIVYRVFVILKTCRATITKRFVVRSFQQRCESGRVRFDLLIIRKSIWRGRRRIAGKSRRPGSLLAYHGRPKPAGDLVRLSSPQTIFETVEYRMREKNLVTVSSCRLLGGLLYSFRSTYPARQSSSLF